MPRKAKRDCDNNPLEKSIHAPDLKEFARWSIKAFLQPKMGYDDKPIPVEELFSGESLKTVLRTQFDDKTFEYIHDNCLAKIPQQEWYRESTIPWTVHTLLGLLNELKHLQIPKDFQPGLLLLYFKFCKGFEIPPPPLL
jgi:hypothetical protein